MSRPVLALSALKVPVSTYLTPAEKAEVTGKATAAHLTLAAFVRRATLGQRVHAVPTGNAQKWAELARTTAALSNLAKHANAAAKRLREQGGEGIVVLEWRPTCWPPCGPRSRLCGANCSAWEATRDRQAHQGKILPFRRRIPDARQPRRITESRHPPRHQSDGRYAP